MNNTKEYQEYISPEKDAIMRQNTYINEARKAGIAEEKKSIAKKLLKMNISLKDISEVTGLSINSIKLL